MRRGPIAIVGNGQAGINTALAMRELGFDGELVIFGDENHWPYDRPPLSKNLCAPPVNPAALDIISHGDAAHKALDIRCGTRVAGVDRARKTITLDDGQSFAYDALVLATGGMARELPELPSDGERVFTLRTMADAHALSNALAGTDNLVVIGGGWLGLEIAAAARSTGKDVLVIEAAQRICHRTLPPDVCGALHRLHTEHGTRILTGNSVTVMREQDSIAVAIAGGRKELFGVAVVAIGLVPNDTLARQAGLACQSGILTSGAGGTNDPDIFAVGDVARLHHDGLGQTIRFESWRNAVTQGRLAARALCGRALPYTEAPWFWSEQFGKLVQIAGMPDPSLQLIDTEGGPRPLWRYGNDRGLACVVGIDRAKDVKQAHRALSNVAIPETSQIARQQT